MLISADKPEPGRPDWSAILGAAAFFVLLFSVLRGLIPLVGGHSSLAKPAYSLSFAAGCLLSLAGLYMAVFVRDAAFPAGLRMLLLCNLAFQAMWAVPLIFLNPDPQMLVMVVYIGLFPFSMLPFGRLSEGKAVLALACITLIAAGMLFLDFLQLNTSVFSQGLDAAIDRQIMIRPDTFEFFGNTARVSRTVGITGPRPHASGNLLAILAVYWAGFVFRRRGFGAAAALLFAAALLGAFTTHSAADILAVIPGLMLIAFGISSGGILSGRRLPAVILAAVILAAAAVFFTGGSGSPLLQWTKRILPDGDWGGMISLGLTDPGMDFLSFLIGHGTSLGLSPVGDIAEISFLKLLMELGVFRWGILMALLCYPVIRYLSAGKTGGIRAVPYAAAVLTGFVSLWHYGSLLRTTSEFVFFALYAQAMLAMSPCARKDAGPPQTAGGEEKR